MMFKLSFLFLASFVVAGSSTVYRSYQTTIYCNSEYKIQKPENVTALVNIVKDAIANNKTVKAFGARHSVTDIICTDGVPISMELICSKTINVQENTVTVGAGCTLMDVVEYLEEFGYSLELVPTYGGITIAGAIGTGAHGSSLKHPTSLSDQVVKLTVITGTGEIVNITSPDDVNAFRVHLGLLGIIIDVTLPIKPLFKMTISNQIQNDTLLFDGSVPNIAREHDVYQLWWFPSQKKVITATGNYVTNATTGNAYTNFIPDVSNTLTLAISDAFESFQATRNTVAMDIIGIITQTSLYTDVIGKPPIYTENGKATVNPATGYANRLQANKCSMKSERLLDSSCSWTLGRTEGILPEESSMAFDISNFTPVINMINETLQLYPASFPLVGIYIRFSQESPSLMGISTNRTTFTVEWATPMRDNPYSDARIGIATFQLLLQRMVNEYGGRPHWAKNGLYYFTQNILNKTTIHRDVFITAMKKFDPNGIFMNKFGERILGISDKIDQDPKVKHCALQDYCLCKENSADCGISHACQTIQGSNVCKDLSLLSTVSKLVLKDPLNLKSILDELTSAAVVVTGTVAPIVNSIF